MHFNTVESLNILGFYNDRDNVYLSNLYPHTNIVCNNDKFTLCHKNGKDTRVVTSKSIDKIADAIYSLYPEDIDDIYSFSYSKDAKEAIYAFTIITAKEKINKDKDDIKYYTDKKNMQRVKSSNVWGYSMKVKPGEKTGDLFIQFKDKFGGPGDIYQYFDFPVRMWSRFIATSSKGHFFWKNIRNVYRYRKLTGDKRGKLPKAVN